MKGKPLPNLHGQYIQGTPNKAPVTEKTVFLCHLTHAVQRALSIEFSPVHVSTRALKHLYDKRPAEEYDFIVHNIHRVVKYPQYIYKNKDTKKGDFCLVSEVKGKLYLCSIELNDEDKKAEMVTAFRLRKTNYLNNYDFLWSWEDDTPPS